MMKKRVKNLLYVVPDLIKVSGGPRTRINNFKKLFVDNNDEVIVGEKKWLQSLKVGKIDLVYIESATNRISMDDFFALLILKYKSKRIVVFIRDIYFELLSENYISVRGSISKIANSVSNYFLTLISDVMVFPTREMGKVFFTKNNYPKRPYYSLPPGTKVLQEKVLPDLNKKIGILYMGSITYKNAGFDHFINFATLYKNNYNFFVLSGDRNIKKHIESHNYIILDSIRHDDIHKYIKNNNIAFAYHTRPRNEYDDLTFPIKVLDFLSFNLPFITENHIPLVELLGIDYPLYCKINSYSEINDLIIEAINEEYYNQIIGDIIDICSKNTYESRHKFLLSLAVPNKE